MNIEVINREAADKTKGFRLQKLRAINLILEELEKSDTVFFYTAIENVEDISHSKMERCNQKNNSTYYEEDKNYDSDSNFTLYSPEVKNTLVSFFDIYVGSWKLSEDVLLGFYTTASIGKERKKKIINGKEIPLPENPILQILFEQSELTDECVEIIKSVVVDEYKSQYSSGKKGHIDTLTGLELKDFRKFLQCITWHFGDENEESLKVKVINKIRDSKLYNIRHQNKEEVIFSIMMEELDRRQNLKQLSRKILTVDAVKLIFNQAESEENDLLMDPVWRNLKAMEETISDKRNLEEKIFSVCPTYTRKKIQHLARLACRSKTEQLSSNRSFLSLKYRAYEACNEYLLGKDIISLTEDQIDDTIKELQSISNSQIQELKSDYTYSVSNKITVNGVVVDLFDSCFLAFDEANNGE